MEQDPDSEIQKYMDMKPAQLRREIDESRQQRELYDSVLRSPVLPYAQAVRRQRRRISMTAGALAFATGAGILFWANAQPAPQNSAAVPTTPVVPASAKPFTPTLPKPVPPAVTRGAAPTAIETPTVTAPVSETPMFAPTPTPTSTETAAPAPSLVAGTREAGSTISIRGGFSVATKEYVCEDLVLKALKQRRECSQQEQSLFDGSRSALESFSNSPNVFAAFPRGYEPVDRSAMSLGACALYQRGASQADVAESIQEWYPVVAFNADALASMSKDRICPQF